MTIGNREPSILYSLIIIPRNTNSSVIAGKTARENIISTAENTEPVSIAIKRIRGIIVCKMKYSELYYARKEYKKERARYYYRQGFFPRHIYTQLPDIAFSADNNKKYRRHAEYYNLQSQHYGIYNIFIR